MLIREPEFGADELCTACQSRRRAQRMQEFREYWKTQLLSGLGCHALLPHAAQTLPPGAVCVP